MYQKFQFFSDEEPQKPKDVEGYAQEENEEEDDEGDEGSEGHDVEGGEPFFLIDPNKVRVEKVRLDKWLWAARFFKTRPLARIEVEAGHVLYNGEVTKPSREIELNAILKIRQRRCERTVIIRGLSTRRRSKEEALLLFEETQESKQARDRQQEWQPKSEFQQQPSFNSAYGHTEQERRPVRFLRRSFGRNTQLPLSQPSHSQSQTAYPPQHSHQHQHRQPQYPSPYHQPQHSKQSHHSQQTRYQPSHPHYPTSSQSRYPAQSQTPYPGSPYSRPPQSSRYQAPPKPRNPQYVDQEFIEPE